jgi:hypothetical protein
MKITNPFFWLLALCAGSLQAQDFYDISQLQEIKLTFFQSNWDYKLDSLKSVNEEAYLLAASVEINGEIFDSVGVKYKGNSSYNAGNQKNPMHIELDHVHKNASYKGYSDVKLGNGFADPSFIREPLSYEILQQYMVAPRANHAKLWINGTYWGVYSNQESINKKFIREHFYTDGERPFFKCNPIGGAGPGGNGNPDLVYSSSDSTAYYSRYELKSDFGWRQLVALMDTLKNHPAGIDKILDVDRALWMLAFNDVLVNLDSYTGAFAQNYYLYFDENGRWIPVVWDLNMSFGGFPSLGTGSGPGGGLSVTQMQNMDPLIQSTNANRPLIQKLLANPVYKRQYLAHVRTILAENFADTHYRDRAVLTDTKKFYTSQNFHNNLDQTIAGGGPGGGAPGITLLMNARNTYLNGTTVLAATAPGITNVSASPATPAPGEAVCITATLANATSVSLGYRIHTWDVFQKTPMYDDGAHQDGAAGDGVWGGSFVADAVQNQYFIYAENANAGRFSPERAEYEFYSIQTDLPAPAVGQIVINELMADNKTGATDEAGQNEDWVEIFNLTDNTYDLEGLYLTDDAGQPDKWAFQHGSILYPHGYLVVWLDEDQSQGPQHASFKLGAGGEFLMLSNGAGGVVDSVSFGPQIADISFGRYPNGTGDFVAMPRTFNAVNSLSSGTSHLWQDASLQILPNPAFDLLSIRSGQPLGRILVSDALGQQVLQLDAGDKLSVMLDLSRMPAGLYFAQVGQRPVKRITLQK